jgi:beta-N-acetylhexosaminidase
MTHLPLGPLMIDIAGTELTDLDCERLCHPLVGGIILFSRNYADPEQLSALTAAIHALRTPALLIAVDHEGGRVQRFRDGFTRLPAMATLGKLWDENPENALAAARQVGYVLAAELRARGVDYSFTPVLDLDYGPSRVIGDRAFHRQPAAASIFPGTVTSFPIRMSNCRSMIAASRPCRKTSFLTGKSRWTGSWPPMSSTTASTVIPLYFQINGLII